MLNKPHALYYNGELIAIITNPDPFGNAYQIADQLSPDEGDAVVIPIPHNMRNLEKWGDFANAVVALGVEEVIGRPKRLRTRQAQNDLLKAHRWVKVDPSDFESAQFEDKTTYGGEIRISNKTNVDIVIKCHGDDCGDDECYWPTTEAVLGALFAGDVPGLQDPQPVDADGGLDYSPNWEGFHDNLCQTLDSLGSPFHVFLRDNQVIIVDDAGEQLLHPIPAATGE